MSSVQRWLCFIYIAACGCDGDALSVGDLRCQGTGVRCETPEPLSADDNVVETTPLAEAHATLRWQADLPCPQATCATLQQSQLLVHADGSATIAIVRSVFEGKPHREVWIGHFDARGALSWHDELFADDPANPDAGPLSVALALDSDDAALLAVSHDRGAASELAVYRMSDAGKRSRLFRSAGLEALSALALDRDELLVAGYYWSQSPDEAARPELARYRRDGSLVWRQSALRAHDDTGLAPGIDGARVVSPMPLAVDASGRALMVVQELGGASLVEVQRDGNVRWDATLGTLSGLPDHAPLPALSLDSKGRPLVAGNPNGVVAVYVVERIVPRGDPLRGTQMLSTLRGREEFWDPFMLGLTLDAQDRVLVASVTGMRDDPRFVIDRYPEGLSQRETFVVPDVWTSDVDGRRGLLDKLNQIRIAHDGAVYVASAEHIARVELPDAQSDTKSSSTPHP
jgi:hypothetical protein